MIKIETSRQIDDAVVLALGFCVGVFISPTASEFLEFGQTLNGRITVHPENVFYVVRDQETNLLFLLAALFEKITLGMSQKTQALVASGTLYSISCWALFSFTRAITKDRRFSLFFAGSLPLTWYPNVFGYPLVLPTDFFIWGQLGFAIFLIGITLQLEGKNQKSSIFVAFALLAHPVWGGALMCFSLLFGLKQLKKITFLTSLVTFGLLTYLYFPKRNIQVLHLTGAELDWKSNLHHFFNFPDTSIATAVVFLVFIPFSITLFKDKLWRLKFLNFYAIFSLGLVSLFLISNYSDRNLLSELFFRAHGGRIGNFFLFLSQIIMYFSFYSLLKKRNEIISNLFLLYLVAPIPTYISLASPKLLIIPFWIPLVLLYLLSGLQVFKLLEGNLATQKTLVVRSSKLLAFMTAMPFTLLTIASFSVWVAQTLQPKLSVNSYNLNNPIYNEIPHPKFQNLQALFTIGYIHGVEGLNIQLLSKLPYFVRINSADYLVDGKKNDILNCNYKKNTQTQISSDEVVLSCLKSYSKSEWTHFCEKIGKIGIVGMKKHATTQINNIYAEKIDKDLYLWKVCKSEKKTVNTP